MDIENIDHLSTADDSVLKDRLRQLQEEIGQEKEKKRQVLSKLGAVVSKRRDEAVKARKASGIETQWREDEEYYEGIDDLNRGDASTYMKPRSADGGLVAKNVSVGEGDCTAFLNVTRPFVDAAESRMVDMVRDFKVIPTPVPEFEENKNNQTPMAMDQEGNPVTVADAISERNKTAYAQANKADRRIRDYLTECGYAREERKVMADVVLVGTGIIEGPIPEWRTIKSSTGGQLSIEKRINPGSKRLDYWDAFPDMNCGEDIQDGEYFIKREYLTARQLRNLRGLPGYETESINKVLNEAPGKRNILGNTRKDVEDDERFEVWYYHGDINPDELCLLDNKYEYSEDKEKPDPIAAVVVMVNDTVIKAYKEPLEHYGYPYDFSVWQRVPGMPFGIGVARQGRTAQKVVLAAFRTLMKNLGLSSVPMMAILRSALEPADGSWELTPGKQWLIREDSGVRNAQEAIQSIVIPPMQAELTELIQLGMKSMEDSTGITFLMQGQQGAAPDTVGGMQIMLQSASSVLRLRVIYFDQVKIEHIKRYYGWILMYGEDDEKGDLIIDVKGSSSVAEREIQSMQLPTILQMTANPMFGKSGAKVFEEWLESLKFDPGQFDMTEEEKAQLAQQQPPADPRLEVAKLNADKDMQIAQLNAQLKQMQIKQDADREAIYAAGVTERTQNDRQAGIEELQLRKELALMDYASKHEMQLNDVKLALADSAMKIRATKELVELEATADRLPKPSVEPPGRAKPGESYTQ